MGNARPKEITKEIEQIIKCHCTRPSAPHFFEETKKFYHLCVISNKILLFLRLLKNLEKDDKAECRGS